jgi:UrcA family protein
MHAVTAAAATTNFRSRRIQERLMNTSVTKLTTFRGALAFVALFATSAAVTTTAAAATPSEDTPSVRVRYDDLNLATEAGTKALYSRIVSAARGVCAFADSRELSLLAASERCQSAAIAKAVNDVHSTQLAAVHASHVSRG